ncbi:hypothetical protein OCU04_009111 [Sclerotinia nivalis]|uniref:Uncharacterized protein n=1 Tax=Sclerotinia nivalis TaxID=352851 RepID=A0A9X0AGZ4_9HELO|nr:hypothetical protein OCU04_009111 [Sclerotinia nivalis]
MDFSMKGSFGLSPEPTSPRVIIILSSPISSSFIINPIPLSRNPFTIQKSSNLLNPIPTQSFNSQRQLDILNSDDPVRSSNKSIPFKINNKRRRQSINSGIKSSSAKQVIERTRDLLVLTTSLEKSFEE